MPELVLALPPDEYDLLPVELEGRGAVAVVDRELPPDEYDLLPDDRLPPLEYDRPDDPPPPRR